MRCRKCGKHATKSVPNPIDLDEPVRLCERCYPYVADLCEQFMAGVATMVDLLRTSPGPGVIPPETWDEAREFLEMLPGWDPRYERSIKAAWEMGL